MPITPGQAAAVARRHGLSLQDAAGLVALADTAEEADRLAAGFAQPVDTAVRDWARALFGNNEPDTDTPTEPTAGNHANREGNNPPAPAGDAMRRYVADLFDRSDP